MPSTLIPSLIPAPRKSPNRALDPNGSGSSDWTRSPTHNIKGSSGFKPNRVGILVDGKSLDPDSLRVRDLVPDRGGFSRSLGGRSGGLQGTTKSAVPEGGNDGNDQARFWLWNRAAVVPAPGNDLERSLSLWESFPSFLSLGRERGTTDQPGRLRLPRSTVPRSSRARGRGRHGNWKLEGV